MQENMIEGSAFKVQDKNSMSQGVPLDSSVTCINYKA